MPIIFVSDKIAEVIAAAMQNGIISSFTPQAFHALPDNLYKRQFAKAALLLNDIGRPAITTIIQDLKKQSLPPQDPLFGLSDAEITHIEHSLAKRPYQDSCFLCKSIAEKIKKSREIRAGDQE